MLFDENYNLAATQSLKNKDIPEGGAKGTILPSLGARPRRCFEKYVDVSIDSLVMISSFRERMSLGHHRSPHSWANPRHQGTSC